MEQETGIFEGLPPVTPALMPDLCREAQPSDKSPEGSLPLVTATDSQAARVIAKFGNARKLAFACQPPLNPASVYKWVYPKNKGGSDGRIPTAALETVLKAARREGILLTPEDLWPGQSARGFK